MTDQGDYAVCAFHLREAAGMHREGMKYKYTEIWLDNYQRDGKLYTLYPPVVGDLLGLVDADRNIAGTFRVIMRDVSQVHYGSAAWPHGTKHPETGTRFTYIVERSIGVFRDEVSEISQDGRGTIDE